MKTRIIGLGNTLLTDDGVGVYVAQEIAHRLTQCGADGADVVESEVAGFALMELMTGWDRVILVDSIRFDSIEPGRVVRLSPTDLHTSLRIRSVHEIDLPTILELGSLLGLKMPRHLSIYGIQVEDTLTLGENLTAGAKQGLKAALELVWDELKGLPEEERVLCPDLVLPAL